MAIPGKNADLIRRFKLYGFGFLLGLLIVSFVYKGKGCQLPNSAKMEELSSYTLEYCNQGTCGVTEADIVELVGSWKRGKDKIAGKGKINYDKSAVRSKPSTYAIEGTISSGKQLFVVIAAIDTISKVISAVDLKNPADTCNCK
jgi:hypothetical protein